MSLCCVAMTGRAMSVPDEPDVTLRSYLEQRIKSDRDRSDAQHAEVIAMIDSMKTVARELATAHADAHNREHALSAQAVEKAYETMDSRLKGMNEFRDQLRDQAATFVRRDYVDTVIAGLAATLEARAKSNSDRIDALERKEANMAGRLTAMGIGIALVVIVLNIALRFL